MLPDLVPKIFRRDLYDFDVEFETLYKGYVSARIMAVVGSRRTGKTSLILTFLSEYSVPHILVDCRAVSLSEYGVPFRSFAEGFSRAVNAFLRRHEVLASRLLSLLRGISWVKVDTSFVRVFLRWRREERFSVASLGEAECVH